MKHELAEIIPSDVYELIGKEIQSVDSPVGIDAKKTHIIIIHKLDQILSRLDRIEQELSIK